MTAALVGVLVAATVLVAGAGWSQAAAGRVRHRLVPRPAQRGAAVRLPPPPWLAGALATAGVAWPVTVVWQGWLAGGVLVAVLAVMVGGPALGAVAVVAVVGLPPLARRLAAGRGDRAVEAALPPLLERIARGLRSGAALAQALEESAEETPAPLRDELRVVLREVAAGDALVVTLDRLAVRRPLPAVRLAVAALALGAETGGAQAQALDGLAVTLRDGQAVAAEVRALSSQARLSALVITVAPVGFALFAASTDPRSARFLLRTPIGIACLAVGLGLDGVAAWWMARITRSVST